MNHNYWDPFWYQIFLKIPKNGHFWRFSVLPRHFKWTYLRHFLEIWPEIFFGTSRHVILARDEKNWGILTFKYCFEVNELKNMIFLGRFLFFWAKFSYEAV